MAVLAAAVLAVSVAWIQFFNFQLKSIDDMRDRQAMTDTFERLRLLMNGAQSCSTILTTAPLTYSTVTPVPIASLDVGGIALAVGTDKNVTISTIRLVHDVTLPQRLSATGVLQDHHRAHLEIAGQITHGDRIHAFNKKYTMDVVLDGTGKVAACTKGQNPEQLACESMGGVFVPATMTCTIAPIGPATGTCPPGQCIGGFDDQNHVICRVL